MEKKNVKILVVDDDRQLADNLVEHLTRLGYQALGIYGGHDAIEKFRQDDFQLVITDLMMPKMGGMELLEALKALDSKVVVLVITGYGSIDSAVTALKKGAFDFVPKPFKMDELNVIINRAIERHSLSKRLNFFRGLTLALLISVPFWLILGIVFAFLWE